MRPANAAAVRKALLSTSEPLRALILSFLVVFLRELVPALEQVDLEAILAPIIAYMLATGLRQLGTALKRPYQGQHDPVTLEPAPGPKPQ